MLQLIGNFCILMFNQFFVDAVKREVTRKTKLSMPMNFPIFIVTCNEVAKQLDGDRAEDEEPLVPIVKRCCK